MIWDWEEKAENAKPCPFCGGTEIKVHKKDESRKQECVIIQCGQCGAQHYGFGKEYERAVENAIETWNRRAS